LDDSQKYRDEAECLRKKAAWERSYPEMQRIMLDMAGLYDRMAKAVAERQSELENY
jgi:hypothetical protein